MIKNVNSFIKGSCLGILVLLVSVLSFLNLRQWPGKAQADSLICTTSGTDLIFTNTEATPKYITCDEYTNCVCPGEPYGGVCIVNHNRRWIRQVAPGQSETCNFSQSVDSLAICKVHQMDILVWDGDYEQQTGQWRLPANCWFLSNKCDRCGEPTPTSTPILTPTPTPTPSAETACWKECDGNTDCQGDTICWEVSGTKRCINPDCETESDCTCNKNCWDVCGHDSECPSGLSCKQIDETKRCVKSECEREQDCNCSVPTPPSVLGAEAPAILPGAGFSGWMLAGLSAILGLALLKLRKLVLHG